MKQYKDSNYYITETGEVYSTGRGKMKKLKLQLIGIGYLGIGFYYKRNKKTISVHRLVAETYIPNPNNYPQVNHINGIKTDNRVENLEWVTHLMNIKHNFDFLGHIKPKGDKNVRSKLTEEQVKYIREKYIYGDAEFGQIGLSKKFKVHPTLIGKIINNKTWKHI